MSEFRYFQSVEGRAVLRYGTGSYIGAVREAGGFRWSKDIVAIPKVECTRYLREYRDAVKGGDLIEFSEQAAKARIETDELLAAEAYEEQKAAQEKAAQEAQDALDFAADEDEA